MATDPLTTVTAAHAEHERLKAATDTALRTLHEAIADAAKAGTKQQDIVAITGLSRERVRQICRAAGVRGTR
ncbi:hypothetical protein [Streptomyces sp. NBC_01506]|uniref:hypothetical protein n=1 Tax=Streptomyces sp. NBC_01506 TaxID=2903887 RepID=UPI0038643C7A